MFERELGRGGMATVYLAHDLRHDRPVAPKVLHPDLAHALGPERFLREIKTAARLQHPHNLSVFDSKEAAGQLWFTMPYVRGNTLRDRLRRERQLPVKEALRIAREEALRIAREEALRIAREAALGLEHAHEEGVVESASLLGLVCAASLTSGPVSSSSDSGSRPPEWG